MRFVLFGLLFFLFSPAIFSTPPSKLLAITIKPTSIQTQLTFILNKKTTGQIKYIPQQQRLIIEFLKTKKYIPFPSPRLTASAIQFVKTEESSNGDLRFIFSVKEKIKWKILYSLNDKNQIKVQIDVFSKKILNNTANLSKQKITRLRDAALQADLLKHLSAFLPKQKKVIHTLKSPIVKIVIDAGHGGKDPGAIGKNGTQEKNIVLAISKFLAQEINQQKNKRAILTRRGDYFVPLRKRLQLARESKADLFIAIHADAYFNNHDTGVSVYALSQRGASNEAARWLSQQENYAELDEVSFNLLKEKSPMLRSTLIDLAQTKTIEDSLLFGAVMLNSLDDIASLHHKRVEQAPFVVLKSPDIPSILVETGFISNPQEEKKLRNPAYQKKIARALGAGIDKYIQKQMMSATL